MTHDDNTRVGGNGGLTVGGFVTTRKRKRRIDGIDGLSLWGVGCVLWKRGDRQSANSVIHPPVWLTLEREPAPNRQFRQLGPLATVLPWRPTRSEFDTVLTR